MAYDEAIHSPASWDDQWRGSNSTTSSPKVFPARPNRKFTFPPSTGADLKRRRRRRWLAFSLRPLFLSILAALSFLTFASIEFMRQYSNRNQGLAFFADSDSIPAGVFFLYNFLPPILAVPYAWLWTLVSADAKRLESYFHVGKPGAPLSVLFIDYTFDSPLLGPIRAFKRGHWPIVWIGPVSLLVSLVFTASQGGLFGLSQVGIASPAAFNSQSRLLDVNDQINALSPNWTDRSSLILANQKLSLPAFVTSNYSVTPFADSTSQAQNESWTVDTQLYWAEPNCHQMSIGSIEVTEPLNDTLGEQGSDPVDGYGVKNKLFELKLKNLTAIGSNCDLSAAIQWKAEFALSGQESFLPLWDNITQPLQGSIDDYPIAQDMIFRGNAWGALFGQCPDFDWFGAMVRYTWLDQMPGPQPNSVSALASATSPQYIQLNVVATACQATYRTANGTATVEGNNHTVSAASTADAGVELSIQQFDPINFEAALQFESSVADPSFENATFEVPIGSFDVFYGPHDTFATLVLKNATNASQLLDGNEWTTQIEAAWQLGFGLAFQDVFDTNAAPSSISGSKVTSSIAISVTALFAILSEALLLLCTVTALATLFVYWRRDNILQSDPDSLAAMCSLATDLLAEKTLGEFAVEGFDQASTRSLKKELSTARLLQTPDGRLLSYHTEDAPSDGLNQIRRTNTFGQEPSDRNSFFLTIPGWILSFFTLLLVLGGGMFVFILSYSQNGFSFLADLNGFSSQLLYSFLPTVIATLIDICFQQVHRDMGVLEAFVRLSQGYQSATDSMALRYSSRPSVITVVPAFVRRHWFMAFLSVTAISTSVLNITSAALFTQTFTSTPVPTNFQPIVSAATLPSSWLHLTLDMSRALEAVQGALADSNDQLPWTDENYSYLPLSIPGGIGDSSASFSAPTVAIGSSMSCQPIPTTPNTTETDSGVVTEQGSPNGGFTNRTAFWTEPAVPGLYREVRCSVEWQDIPNGAGNASFFDSPLTIGGDATFSADANDDGTTCARSALFFLSTDAPDNSTTIQIDFPYTCSPSLEIRDAMVTFDQSGQILSSTIAPTTSAQTASFFSNGRAFLGEFAANFGSFSAESRTATSGGSADWATLLALAVQNNNLDEATFANVSSSVFTRIFAAFFSTYRDQILTTADTGSTSIGRRDAPSPVQGSATTRQARVVASTPLFVLSLTLLTLYLVAAVLVLVLRRQRYSGPRAPRTVGAVLPWVAHSRLLRDMRGLHALRSDERDGHLQRQGRRFGFGWFLDERSVWRLGLEYEPHVKRTVDEGAGPPLPVVANGYYVDGPVSEKLKTPTLAVDTLAVPRALSPEVSPL